MPRTSSGSPTPSLPRLEAPTPPLGLTKPSSNVLAPKLTRLPRASDVWLRLDNIDTIDVHHAVSEDVVAYELIITYKHSAPGGPIDTRSSVSSTSSSTTGEWQSRHSFQEFETLREHVKAAIRHSHAAHCQLCDWLAVVMSTKLSQPALLTATIHRSPVTRAKRMRKFLNSIVSELREHKAMCPASCRAQYELPLLLFFFIFGEEHGADCMPPTLHSNATA